MEKINYRHIESPEMRADESNSRKFSFVASDSTRDSAGTVLNQAGWDLSRFNRNGIIGYQHKVYGGSFDSDDPDNVIGKGKAYVEKGRLMVDIELEPEGDNKLADKVCKKLHFGTLNAVSVGFVPVGKGQWGKDEEALTGSRPTYYYEGQQLLEISVVNIPANPNALRRSLEDSIAEELKDLREQTEPEAPVQEEQEEPVQEPEAPVQEEEEDKSLDIEKEKLLLLARAAASLS